MAAARKTTPMSREQMYPGRRRAQVQSCPKCRAAWIASGWDDDSCAMHAAAELEALSWPGELAARLDGRRTYSIDEGRLLSRGASLPQRPCESPVIAEHKCGSVIPNPWRKPISAPINEMDFNECPF